MRYFNYNEPDELGDPVQFVVSEEDIRRDYYPIWYENMCRKYGKEHVDEVYSFEECLEDWTAVHWAF